MVAPPKRVYGLDAADVPLPPPLAPSAAFGSRPLHNIPDEREPPEFSQRPTAPYSYSHQDSSYGRRSSQAQIAYTDERRDSGPRGSWTRDAPSSASFAHSNDRPRSSIADPSGYSPTSEIQPPSWYHHYAHAVPLKQPQGQQQHRPSYSSSSSALPRRGSEYGGAPHPEESLESSEHHSRSYGAGSQAAIGSGNRRLSGVVSQDVMTSTTTSTSRASVSHSVHPFDMASGGTSPKEVKSENASKPTWNSALGKRDRGVGGGQDVDPFVPDDGVKAKRKRANPEQLSVLNAAFERSYFPSTEERHRLSKLTNMCPRTVQIWFQNKRQSVKARTEAMDIAVSNHNGTALERRRRGSMAQERAREEQHYQQQQQQQQQSATLTSDRRRTVSHDSHRPTPRGEMASDLASSSSSSPHNNAPLHHHPQEQRYHHQPYYPEHPHPHSSHSYPHHSSQSQSQFQPRSSPQSPLRQSITNASIAANTTAVATSPELHRGEKRRNSGPLTPSDAALVALQIQPDDRNVDYFSRKRRATIARMEHSQQSHG